MATILVRMGDIFAGSSDLTILPCSAKGTVSSATEKWKQMFGIKSPKELGLTLRLGTITAVYEFPGPKSVCKNFCFAASVLNDHSSTDVITQIGAAIGRMTADRSDIRIVETPLLGTGAGGLPAVEAGKALAEGFASTAATDARLYIFMYDHERVKKLQAALKSEDFDDPNKPAKGDTGFLSAINLVETARKAVPAFKWAIAAAGLLGLAASIVTWGLNIGTLALVAGILIVGAMAFIALTWIQELKPKQTSRMAAFAAWSFLLFLVAPVGLILTSSTIDWPWRLRTWINDQVSRKVNTKALSVPDPTASVAPPALSKQPVPSATDDDADLRATFPSNTPAWSEQKHQDVAMGRLFYVRIENTLKVPVKLKYITHVGKVEELNIAAGSTAGMGCGDPSNAHVKFASTPDPKLKPNLPIWKLETRYLDHMPNQSTDRDQVPLYRLIEAVPGEVACVLVKK